MRTAIYIRVSTDIQKEQGFSIPAQVQRLTDYVNSQGWYLVEKYIDDGYSAKDLNRPKMQEMIKGIKDKRFDVVLVYKLDRLVRSVGDLHELLQLFDKYGCKFKSATEMFETTTAMGRFFITLVAAMASWEREQLSERVFMGMSKKAEEGLRNGGSVPFGYDFVDGEMKINEAEAKLVRYIFEESELKGGKMISYELNKKGITTKNGARWGANTVNIILTNPVYYGMMRWNYKKKNKRTFDEKLVQGTHEPIVTKEQFDKIQSIRKKRGITKEKGSTYPFSGILKCKRCGGSISGSTQKRPNGNLYRFYRCSVRDNYGSCDMPNFSEAAIDKEFIYQLDIENIEIETPDQEAVDVKKVERELKKVRKRMENIDELYIIGGKTIKWYNEKMEIEKIKEAELLKSLEDKDETISPEELKEVIKSLKQNWHLISYDQRKRSLQSLFEYIEVDTIPHEGKKTLIRITDYALLS